MQILARCYTERYGREIAYPGQMGYPAATAETWTLEKACRNLTLDRVIATLESMVGFRLESAGVTHA